MNFSTTNFNKKKFLTHLLSRTHLLHLNMRLKPLKHKWLSVLLVEHLLQLFTIRLFIELECPVSNKLPYLR
jgi:hypothetical protein